MKRCPQCNFIYLDTDKVCDLDGTLLVFVSEADVDAVDNGDSQRKLEDIMVPKNIASSRQGPPKGASAPGAPDVAPAPGLPTNPASPSQQSRKALVVAALVGLTIALVLFAVYYVTSRRAQQTTQGQGQVSNESSSPALTQHQIPTFTPSPPDSASPSEDVSPSPTARSSPSPRTTPARATVSSNPVSTGREEQGKSGSSIIRLTDGVRIEADEVWRTKEGIWYRRNGVVTLLKRNRVQAIERKP